MSTKQETIIINDYGGSRANIRRRTTAKGKTTDRVSFEIRAEPLVHMFDDEALGAGVAEAIRAAIERQIKDIGEFAADATWKARSYAAIAIKEGRASRSQTKRYSGGRMGAMPPAQTARKFNDSGRLAKGIHVRQNTKMSNSDSNAREGHWTINVPANRLTEDMRHIIPELFRLVPALGNPKSLLSDPKVNKELRESLDMILQKAKNIQDIKYAQLRAKKIQAAKAALALARLALVG